MAQASIQLGRRIEFWYTTQMSISFRKFRIVLTALFLCSLTFSCQEFLSTDPSTSSSFTTPNEPVTRPTAARPLVNPVPGAYYISHSHLDFPVFVPSAWKIYDQNQYVSIEDFNSGQPVAWMTFSFASDFSDSELGSVPTLDALQEKIEAQFGSAPTASSLNGFSGFSVRTTSNFIQRGSYYYLRFTENHPGLITIQTVSSVSSVDGETILAGLLGTGITP